MRGIGGVDVPGSVDGHAKWVVGDRGVWEYGNLRLEVGIELDLRAAGGAGQESGSEGVPACVGEQDGASAGSGGPGLEDHVDGAGLACGVGGCGGAGSTGSFSEVEVGCALCKNVDGRRSTRGCDLECRSLYAT